MSVTPFEKAFIQHLTLPESLSRIVREEFDPEMLPTESLRPVYGFALAYWHAEATDGYAPTPEIMREHHGVILAEHEIDLDIEPEGILDYAMEGIKGSWIDRKWQRWVKDFAGDMATADILAKPEMLDGALSTLMEIQQKITSSTEHVEIRQGVNRALIGYHDRRELRLNHQVNGGVFGIPPVDLHMAGMRPGELVVFAGPPKSGKSYMVAVSALACWLIGMTPVIYTLENSPIMTVDRIACYAAGVPSRAWQRGECTPDQVERVHAWLAMLQDANRPFHIIQPEPGKRTMAHMTRRTSTLGDIQFIDQLTFVEPRPQDERAPKYQQIGNSLHDLKADISTGSNPIPTFLAHQINREGVKQAEKTGYLEMYHMAEAAEVERTADWVLGLWRTRGQRDIGEAYFQTLAARREDIIDWRMRWTPWNGIDDAMYGPGMAEEGRDSRVVVLNEIDLRAED